MCCVFNKVLQKVFAFAVGDDLVARFYQTDGTEMIVRSSTMMVLGRANRVSAISNDQPSVAVDGSFNYGEGSLCAGAVGTNVLTICVGQTAGVILYCSSGCLRCSCSWHWALLK